MLSPRPTAVPRLRIACIRSSSRSLFTTSPATVGHFRPSAAQNQVFQASQVRGKKTRTVMRLEDLPQGPIVMSQPLSPLPTTAAEEPEEDNVPAYPTVVLQARRNMQKFDNCVLLTRVGGFYELYFDQAEEYGPLLNLKVAQKKTNAGPVSMAGFPIFQLDRFLKILVQDLDRHVAIAEEFPNDSSAMIKSGGLMHDRRVARIVTPGTLIDENFMDPYANNYVLAIHLPEEGIQGQGDVGMQQQAQNDTETADPRDETSTPLGLAWLDISTGYFFTQPTTLASLGSVLSRVSPREIVLDEALESSKNHGIISTLTEDRYMLSYSPLGDLQKLSDWEPMLEASIPSHTADKFTDNEVKAGSLLLHYVRDRLRGLSMKLQPPLRHESMQIMSIDKNSMRSLEIKTTIKDNGFRGSLLHAVRRTVTKSGARLLTEWLSSPSTSLEVINFRQDLVSRFIQNKDLQDSIIILLRRSHDSQRLVQKFALNRGEPDDLLRLASTIKATEDIVNLLKNTSAESPSPPSDDKNDCLSTMISRLALKEPRELAHCIRDAIDEEGLVVRHQLEDSETGEMIALAQEIVKTEGSEQESSMLLKGVMAKKQKQHQQQQEQKKKAPSIRDYYGEDNEIWIMKPGASPGLSRLHAELSSLTHAKIELTETLRARLNAPTLTLKWTPGLGHICHVKGKDARRTPTPPEWTLLGERLDKTRSQIRAEEQRVFARLREQVVLNLVKLRRNASVLDELDITTSFAQLAVDRGLTRPLLNNTQHTVIMGGRHPTVEGGLAEQGRTFQRNDCLLGAPGHGRVWLITGPNMAGKSTFLRQNALITILAQIGCYVPADYAELGVVDAIFSRVGSADDLFRDQSTFMVEMMETAAILRQATPRSFVIMDEIGRGTTPEDGTAVAFASLHHLLHINKCRGLFATHFHAVADLVAEQHMRLEDGGTTGAVEMYCTDVEEDDRGGFVYVHKLQKGINRKSHALKVARLAGLPEPAMRIARQVLGSSEGVTIQGRSETSPKQAPVVG
ncbi:muts domain V-domain-containing protein [Bombardia bombarda]|uniref:Muts domain V-domain-containing protein n=1 Tax=Bombardia bombarda TaxID=252184 RepID=A0AA39WMH4_9PEZI|nr:muts domain V-domain-containing protein [Bombardia bombarda]